MSRRALLLAWLCAACALPTAADTVNSIVAVVNDEVITGGDLASQVQRWEEERERGSAPEPDAQPPSAADVRQQALHRLIEKRLMLQEAKRAGITISADEIAHRVDEVRDRFPSEETFRESLAASNMTKEQLKEQIRDQLLVDRIIDQKVRSTILVSPQEVSQAITKRPDLVKGGDRVRAMHILIRVNETRSAERAKALAEDLHQKLLNGGDFMALAKRYSEDPHASDGGTMGWVAEGELLPELDHVLFSLHEGEVSAPVETRLGFHLLRVDERRTAQSLSMLEANQAVYQTLYQEKFQAAFHRWLGDIAQHAYIEIVDAT